MAYYNIILLLAPVSIFSSDFTSFIIFHITELKLNIAYVLYISNIYLTYIYIYMLSPGSGSNQRGNKAPCGNCSFMIGTNMDYSIVSIIII